MVKNIELARTSIDAKPFSASELRRENRAMSSSDSGESGGGGSCGSSASGCPSSYVPMDLRINVGKIKTK